MQFIWCEPTNYLGVCDTINTKIWLERIQGADKWPLKPIIKIFADIFILFHISWRLFSLSLTLSSGRNGQHPDWQTTERARCWYGDTRIHTQKHTLTFPNLLTRQEDPWGAEGHHSVYTTPRAHIPKMMQHTHTHTQTNTEFSFLRSILPVSIPLL